MAVPRPARQKLLKASRERKWKSEAKVDIEFLVVILRNLSTTTYAGAAGWRALNRAGWVRMMCKELKIECTSRAKDELWRLLQQSKRVEEAETVSVGKEDSWGRD